MGRLKKYSAVLSFIGISIALIILMFSFYGFIKKKRGPEQRTLKVSMYPFLPDAETYYEKLEEAFETLYPDVDLVINLNRNYYNPTDGIISEAADVYELDCIFLKDFIDRHKIQPLKSIVLGQQNLLPIANIVYQNNLLYAQPQYIIGNFLFYSKRDTALLKIIKLRDLESKFGNKPNAKKGLLIDLADPVKVSKLYVDALLDEYEKTFIARKYCTVENLDKITIENIRRLLPLINKSLVLSNINFEQGFYEKQFAKQNGRAFVGSSESLYEIINEINALPGKHLNLDDIAVNDWNSSDSVPHSSGSVIALSMSSRLKMGQEIKDANHFMWFCNSIETFKLLMKSGRGKVPRYLLPPYKTYYQDTSITNYAPLYKRFYPLVLKMTAFTDAGMAEQLKFIGEKIKKELAQ